MCIFCCVIMHILIKGDDSNEFMSNALEEMTQEQEKLIEEKQIITG